MPDENQSYSNAWAVVVSAAILVCIQLMFLAAASGAFLGAGDFIASVTTIVAFSITNGVLGGLVLDPGPMSIAWRLPLGVSAALFLPANLLWFSYAHKQDDHVFINSLLLFVDCWHVSLLAIGRAAIETFVLKRRKFTIFGLMMATAWMAVVMAASKHWTSIIDKHFFAPECVIAIGLTLLVLSVSLLFPWMFRHLNLGWRVLGVLLLLALLFALLGGLVLAFLGAPFFLQVLAMQFYVQCSQHFRDRAAGPLLGPPRSP